MKRYTMFIGLNDKDSKQQEISTLDAYKTISRIVGDCTISESKGIYTHEDGTRVIETSLVCQVLDFRNNFNLNKVVDSIKCVLNQESVAVVTEDVESVLL